MDKCTSVYHLGGMPKFIYVVCKIPSQGYNSYSNRTKQPHEGWTNTANPVPKNNECNYVGLQLATSLGVRT